MDTIDAWHEFNVAMLGATAALAGLVIVAVSVNIEVVIKAAALTTRVAAGIAGLVLAIVVCAVGLFPALDPVAYGVVVAAAALLTAGFGAAASVRIYQNRDAANRLRAGKSASTLLAPVAYFVGGILLTAGAAGGLAWLGVGAIIAIVAALFVSWVVLVEVLR